MKDQGVAMEEFEKTINDSSDEFDTMEKNINKMIDFMDELEPLFNSNDMQKVSNNLDGIVESYQNIKDTISSYVTVLKEVKTSYQEQAETIANEFSGLVTD